jgi:hypothetical protein
VSPVKYELAIYIPQDDILHSHRRENLKSYLPKLNYINDTGVEMVEHLFLNSDEAL